MTGRESVADASRYDVPKAFALPAAAFGGTGVRAVLRLAIAMLANLGGTGGSTVAVLQAQDTHLASRVGVKARKVLLLLLQLLVARRGRNGRLRGRMRARTAILIRMYLTRSFERDSIERALPFFPS